MVKTLPYALAVLLPVTAVGITPILFNRLSFKTKLKLKGVVIGLTIVSILIATGLTISITAYYIGGLLIRYAVAEHSYLYPTVIYIGGITSVSTMAIMFFVDFALHAECKYRNEILALALVGSTIIGTLWALVYPHHFWGNYLFLLLTKSYATFHAFFILSIFGFFFWLIPWVLFEVL